MLNHQTLRVWVKFFFLASLILFIACLVFLFYRWNHLNLESARAKVEDFILEIQNKNLESIDLDRYFSELVMKSYQNENLRELSVFFRAFDGKDLDFKTEEMLLPQSKGSVYVKVKVTTPAREISEFPETVNLGIVLTKEKGLWRIYSVHSDDIYKPSRESLHSEAKISLEKFFSALDHDFKEFYQHISVMWQEQIKETYFNKEIEKGNFDELIKYNELIKKTNAKDPVFIRARPVSDTLIWAISGQYRTYPSTLYYDLHYIYEGVGLKLLGLNIDIICHTDCKDLKKEKVKSDSNNIVLLIDNSVDRRTSELEKENLRNALMRFIQKIDEEIPIAIYLFGEKLKKIDAKSIDWQESLNFQEEESLTDKALRGVIADESFLRSLPGRILLITDNLYWNKNTANDVEEIREAIDVSIKEAKRESVRVDVIGWTNVWTDNPNRKARLTQALRLASDTGGYFIPVVDSENLGKLFDNIGRELSGLTQGENTIFVNWTRLPETLEQYSQSITGKFQYPSIETSFIWIIMLATIPMFLSIAFIIVLQKLKQVPNEFHQANGSIVIAFLSGSKKDSLYPLAKKSIKIGKAEDNDICLETGDSYQASINYKDNVYWIYDEGSSKGVFVNNERIAKSQILINDFIKVGDYEFRIVQKSTT